MIVKRRLTKETRTTKRCVTVLEDKGADVQEEGPPPYNGSLPLLSIIIITIYYHIYIYIYTHTYIHYDIMHTLYNIVYTCIHIYIYIYIYTHHDIQIG